MKPGKSSGEYNKVYVKTLEASGHLFLKPLASLFNKALATNIKLKVRNMP